MTRRSRVWQVAAGLFAIINVAGAGYALAAGEQMHAALHVALLVVGLGAYAVWRLAVRERRQNLPQDLPNAQLTDERLQYLQQSVDAIALEVERIGEAQRFSDKLRAEQRETLPPKKDQ